MIGKLHDRLRQTEHVYMVLVALAIGLLGGLFSVAFRRFIHFVQVFAWRNDTFLLDHVRSLPAWWKIGVPAAGGLLVGLIIHFFAREAKGHGVPEVMEAVALRGGRIRPRVVIAKMIASGICIASGGSVGREGPIVQIGSSLGSAIGQWLRMGERRLRTLVGCGAAAGIAGTFNAPVAGALFAVEVILGDFGVSQFSPIVISSVAATVVSRRFLGDFPAFEVPHYALVNPAELFAYALLGVIAGLTALAFVRVLYGAEDLFDAVPIPGPAKTVLGGAMIGVIALKFPEIYGVGYEAIGEALKGGMVWHLLLALAVIKILAVSTTIGSGGSGGIFAPSLFVGAMTGGAVGAGVHSIWPETTAGPGAYALVGMGAVVAAATHAPITAIVIIFEMTNDYKIILPLMITCIIATLLAMQIQKASIYTMKLLRRGVDIREGQTVNVLRNVRVRDVMRTEFTAVQPQDRLLSIVSRFIEKPGGSVFVVDPENRLLGVITINDIRPILNELDSMDSLLIAQDMMQESGFLAVFPEDALDGVMTRFGHYRFEAPVLEGDRVIGSVWPEDVIRRYEAELFKRDMASSMSVAVGSGAEARAIPGAGGMSMTEIPAPASFLGRTMADIAIRKRYDVTILLIKRKGEEGDSVMDQLPNAAYVFREGDVMLVMGREECLRRLELAP
ncbi:MAG: chloride channel protein [Candidatus Eisenbacteria bacterium]|nr:chloride channel protein [Candidatus Eisenbacteria bacterium]